MEIQLRFPRVSKNFTVSGWTIIVVATCFENLRHWVGAVVPSTTQKYISVFFEILYQTRGTYV